jgi:hypothetical protein
MAGSRDEVIAAYEARRLALLSEARRDDATRRPEGAARKREAARHLFLAEIAEELDPKPDFWAERET